VVREVNEDSYLVLTAPAVAPELTALLVVADGMGGHQAGDVASGEVIRTLDGLFTSSRYREVVGYSQERDDYYIVVVKEVLEQLNDHLYNLSSTRPELRGMGTTGSIGLLVNRQFFLGHVGDSRIYRLRSGTLQQLTQDHRLVEEQVQAGLLTREEAERSEKRNVLTRCLGNNPVLRVDRSVHDIQVGDQFFLCSDGLTEIVSDSEVAQVLSSAPTPQEACNHFIERANQGGGPDNITVVLARIAKGEGSDLPGGRAFGPHRQNAGSQKDTVKILRGKVRSRPARPRAKSAEPWRPSPWLKIGAATVAASLACAVAGTAFLAALQPILLKFLEKIPVLGAVSASNLGALLVAFLMALLGIVVGLFLSRWLPAPRSKAGSAERRASPDRDASRS
jgi:protein phosphatase